jgi:hypothetical protein
MKIHPVGAELFHANRQTDRHDEANSCFSQFCIHAYTQHWQQQWTVYYYCKHWISVHGNVCWSAITYGLRTAETWCLWAQPPELWYVWTSESTNKYL